MMKDQSANGSGESSRLLAAPLMGIGRVLLTLGTPAHRMEAALKLVARRLNISAEFFSTPTSLIASVGQDEQQQTLLVRVRPGTPDLGKLSEIAGIMEQLSEGGLGAAAAYQRANEVLYSPPMYGPVLSWLAYVVISASAATFLGGGWNEIMLAAVIGSFTGLIGVAGTIFGALARLHIPLTATLATLLAYLACHYFGNTDLLLPVMAGLITLIPGLEFTAATRELATGHLVSGSARMAGALMIFIMLTFGLAMGSQLGYLLAGPLPATEMQALPQWISFSAMPLIAMGFVVLFRALPGDWPWIMLACAVGLGSLKLGQYAIGPILGASIGGLCVGLAGNIFARIARRPGSIIHTPGLLLLVPGSIGFSSFATLLNADTIHGVERIFAALLTAVSLIVGMILSSVLIPPRNEL